MRFGVFFKNFDVDVSYIMMDGCLLDDMTFDHIEIEF